MECKANIWSCRWFCIFTIPLFNSFISLLLRYSPFFFSWERVASVHSCHLGVKFRFVLVICHVQTIFPQALKHNTDALYLNYQARMLICLCLHITLWTQPIHLFIKKWMIHWICWSIVQPYPLDGPLVLCRWGHYLYWICWPIVQPYELMGHLCSADKAIICTGLDA